MGFFGNLMGGSSRKTMVAQNNAASAQMDQGIAQADPFYQQAIGRLDPFSMQGIEGFQRYADLLGLNGDAARASGQAVYNSDPMFSGLEQQNQQRLSRYFNAGGSPVSGASMAAANQASLNNYGSYLDRLSGLGSAGMGAAQQQGALDTARGDMRFGVAQQKAGNSISLGNALAQSRAQGMNNMMGLVGSIGGAMLGGFAPGAGGTSAFGNIIKGMSGGGFR